MAFCSNCGTHFAVGDKFCPNCGAELVETAPESRRPKNGFARRLLFPMLLLAVAAAIGYLLFFERGARLPGYLQRMDSGAIYVDLEELTGGRARPGEHPYQVETVIGSELRTINCYAISYKSGFSYEGLEDPPLSISPVMTPGDGVAGIYFVSWLDEVEQSYHLEWIVETEWKDIIGDQLYLYGATFSSEEGLQVKSDQVNLSRASGPVLVHRLTFELQDPLEEYIFDHFTYAVATNVDGEYEEIVRAVQLMDFNYLGNDAVVVLGMVGGRVN